MPLGQPNLLRRLSLKKNKYCLSSCLLSHHDSLCSCKIQNVRASFTTLIWNPQRKLQHSIGARIRKLKKEFVVRGFKSHGGLCTCSYGCKKELGAWGLWHVPFFSYVITPKWGLRDRGYNLLQKKMLCFVVITDGFQKINLHVEAKQATSVFKISRRLSHPTATFWVATPTFP